MLELRSISIGIQGDPLLSFDSLKAEPGSIVSLLGPSGSGKSTFLKVIAGLQDPEIDASGTMKLGDLNLTNLPAHRRQIGYVEQRPALFPHLNVFQNLAFGLKGDCNEVEQAMEIAGLLDFRNADIATLSGGQASRVSLMRTLLSKPRALLLDEPFAALDLALRDSVRDFVFSQVRALGLPTLLVTHDPTDAAKAEGPVFHLENHSLRAQEASHV